MISQYDILNKNVKEYHKLCEFLEITPTNKFEFLVDKYNEKQWKRPDIK